MYPAALCTMHQRACCIAESGMGGGPNKHLLRNDAAAAALLPQDGKAACDAPGERGVPPPRALADEHHVGVGAQGQPRRAPATEKGRRGP
jgi:hypothetical protein